MKKKKNILRLDDDLDLSLLFKTVLEDNGFRVDWYTDPILALKQFKRYFYDLLILDIKMPKMNGFELFRELKKIDKRIKACTSSNPIIGRLKTVLVLGP